MGMNPLTPQIDLKQDKIHTSEREYICDRRPSRRPSAANPTVGGTLCRAVLTSLTFSARVQYPLRDGS